MRRLWIGFVFLLLSSSLPAQKTETERSWNRAVVPFRIIGNVYYVGANEVTSYLIATPAGLILLDSGFAETVPLIEKNVRTLGFRLEDVKLLLASHPHIDHGGGLAELKRRTHAPFVSSREDAAAFARGDRDNFSWGDENAFEPVNADRIVDDGDSVTLGGVTLTARITPGHTGGCTTWTMKANEGGRTVDVVFVGSASVPGYRVVNNPKATRLVEQYETAFRVLKSLPCDVFLAAHGSFFNLEQKREAMARGGATNPFIDPDGYRTYVRDSEERFREIVRAQSRAN